MASPLTHARVSTSPPSLLLPNFPPHTGLQPFYAPDLFLCVTDPHRVGHEQSFHPGDVCFRRGQRGSPQSQLQMAGGGSFRPKPVFSSTLPSIYIITRPSFL